MATINALAKLVRMLPKAQGSAGRITLGAKQLEQIATKNKKAAKAIKVFTRGTENPALDIAYKAQSNYSIAGIRVRDGQKVIGNGAISITNPGTNQAVIKYRAADGSIQANGFINAGGRAKANDIAMNIARKGGQIKADVQVGDAMVHHFVGNEQKLVDIAKELNADSLLREYVDTTRKFQQKLDAGMVDIRKGLRGETPAMVKPLDKSVKPAEFASKKVVKQNLPVWKPEPDLKKVGKRYPDLVANGSLIFDKPIKAKDLGKLLKEKFPHLGVKTTTQSKPMTPWEYLKS